MKKAIKIASAAAVTIAAAGIATASVLAWGDSAGGRRTYTLDEINSEKLGDTIVFNSIKDTGENVAAIKEGKAIMPLTDERFFVGARDAATGNNGPKNVWASNTIEAEEGKTYIVRLYVHNNNPKGTEAIARDVTTTFKLGKVVDTEQRVEGYINTSSNANLNEYYDSVVFTSKNNRKFYLDYVEGSALLENNGIGANGGVKLSDDIISKGVKIGYDALDGNVPGCYQYANYVTIEVTPVFEDSSIEKKVRLAGSKEWKESVDAKVGDKVEFQIHYKNKNNSTVNNVIIRDSLPDGVKYVAGSTKLYNATFPKGASTDSDSLVGNSGVNVGSYAVNGDAYVRFTAEIEDKNLAKCGTTRLINWAKASANGFAVQDNADVYVTKQCSTPEPTPTQTPSKNLPETGAAGIATGIIGLGSVITAGGYYIASRKQLR